ncbi:MAG: hypothetical protein O2960_14995 [Verrucomicrobia bacterium]|nr:hypothetical protein [Verrucomicrobiota bacterium]
MIGVIADDLTGAAELGGVGFRFGLRSEIHTRFERESSADLIALDTASRSCPESESVRRVSSAAESFQTLAPDFVYKKVDSALRGRILAEINAMRKAIGKSRALLIPANPSLNRIIRGGQYYINEVPIHQTGFKNDPEYPCRSSSVVDILGTTGLCPISVCRVDEPIPDEGIIIGEVSNRKELHAWAARLDETTLPAGAAEFFAVILETRGFQPIAFGGKGDVRSPDGKESGFRSAGSTEDFRELFVCGSASESTERFLKDARARGVAVLSMPRKLAESGSKIDEAKTQWLEETLNVFRVKPRVIVAIDCPLNREPNIAERLLEHLIRHVEAVLERVKVHAVFVEGGATAARLMERMRWTRLDMVREFTQGVVSLLPHGHSRPVVTMKPGSYVWAPEISGESR